MQSDVENACAYAGKLVCRRICDALRDKPVGTKTEIYVRKGQGVEAEDLEVLIGVFVSLPKGYVIDRVRLTGAGSHAAVIAVRSEV